MQTSIAGYADTQCHVQHAVCSAVEQTQREVDTFDRTKLATIP